MRNTIVLAALTLTACTGDKGFVTYNDPPSVTILEPLEGTVYAEGDPVTFVGQAADNNDVSFLTVEWGSSVDGILPDENPPDGDGVVQYVTSNLSEGIHVITLRATDGQNAQGETTVQITVEDAPDAPSLVITNPPPNVNPPIVGIEGVPFVFGVQVADADTPPEELVIELNSNPGGFVCFMVPDSTGTATCSASLGLGSYLLSFTVEDTDGFEATRNVAFDVADAGDVDQDGDGHTPNGGDCNDSAITVYPGAPEVCDGLDNDCNPLTEVDVNSPCYDDDGDGFCEGPPCTNTSNTTPDCDDAAPNAYPGNPEICDGIDNDCVNGIDNGFNSVPYYIDFDADGYGAMGATPQLSCEPIFGSVTNDYDCNDLDNTINPDAVENETNGIDDDCDGLTDEGGANFDDDFDGYCEAPPCSNVPGSQIGDPQDCDDTNGQVNPGAPEVCGDGLDNNCDFDQNDQNALGCTLFYLDQDGDLFGSTTSACHCEPHFPSAFTATNSTDCNDASSIVNPGQIQFFNTQTNGSYDYNCDGNEERQSTLLGSGCMSGGITDICQGQDGWVGSVPPCGQSGTFEEDCGFSLDNVSFGCGICITVTCGLDPTCVFNTCVNGPGCAGSSICANDGGPTVQSCR